MTTFRALHRSGRLALAVLTVLAVVLAVAAAPAMAEFGLQRFALSARNGNGTPDVQAGSHPFALTNTFVLNLPPGGNLKDVRLELPPGFVGDPNATPHCGYQAFINHTCSNETVIGVSTTYITEAGHTEVDPTTDPVYNLVPPTGVAAEFGFVVAEKTPVFLDTTVRTGTDYGLDTTVPNISQAVLVAASKVTIWGVPAAPAHNLIRGSCLHTVLEGAKNFEEEGAGLRVGEDEVEGPKGTATEAEIDGGEVVILGPTHESENTGGCATQTPLVPLLTNPTSCGAPRTATLGVDDWEEPGVFHSLTASLPPLEGCEKLDFSPTISVSPDGTAGSTPTGLNVGVHVPQETTENSVGLAESDVKNTTVTLPVGCAAQRERGGWAAGLLGCADRLHRDEGTRPESTEPGVQTPQFTPEKPSCPDASKIANARIKTPLLEGELEGAVYLAAPQNFTFAGASQENPFSSLISMYLVAEEPIAGVLVKLAGEGRPEPGDGTARLDVR